MLNSHLAWLADGYDHQSSSDVSHSPRPPSTKASEGRSAGGRPSSASRVLGRRLYRAGTSRKLRDSSSQQGRTKGMVDSRPASAPVIRVLSGKSSSSVLRNTRLGVTGLSSAKQLHARRPYSAHVSSSREDEVSDDRREEEEGGRQQQSYVRVSRIRRPTTASVHSVPSTIYDDDSHLFNNISMTPFPEFRMLDRHSRCFDKVHLHQTLVLNRPQYSCNGCGSRCPVDEVGFRPNSAASHKRRTAWGDAENDGSWTPSGSLRVEPGMRKTDPLQVVGKKISVGVKIPGTRKRHYSLLAENNIRRGVTPHYCNFVRTKPLHQPTHPVVRPHDDDEGLGDELESLASLDAAHLAQQYVPATPVRPDSAFDHSPAHSDIEDTSQQVTLQDGPSEQRGEEMEPETLPHPTIEVRVTPTREFEDSPRLPPQISSSQADLEEPEEELADEKAGEKGEDQLDLEPQDTDPSESKPEGSSLAAKLIAAAQPEETPSAPSRVTFGSETETSAAAPWTLKDKKPAKKSPTSSSPSKTSSGSPGKKDMTGKKASSPEKMEKTPPSPPPADDRQPTAAPEPDTEPSDGPGEPQEVAPPLVDQAEPEVKEAETEVQAETPTAEVQEPQTKEKKKKKKEKPRGKTKDPFSLSAEEYDKRQELLEIAMRNRRLGPETSGDAVQQQLAEEAAAIADHAKPNRKVQPWLMGRFAFSQQSCRFELPIDIWELETIAPREYLSRYAKLTQRRSTLYGKVFYKHRDVKLGNMGIKELEKALNDIMADSVTPAEFQRICEVICLADEERVDQKYFCGIAAITERVLYHKFVTDDTKDLLEHRKEYLESCDFQNLKARLDGLSLSSPVRDLLFTIRDS